jgi:hypothetical protein
MGRDDQLTTFSSSSCALPVPRDDDALGSWYNLSGHGFCGASPLRQGWPAATLLPRRARTVAVR